MTSGPLDTLFHPFETGDISVPDQGRRVLFLGAEPGFRLPEGFAAELSLVQGFRPSFLKLKAARHAVTPAAEGADFDVALVLAGKFRGLNEARIHDAWSRLKPGGLLVVAGGKDDGIDSLRKRTATQAEIQGSASKYHGVVFWLRKLEGAVPPFAEAQETMVEGRFHTAPGMFSQDRIDAGSRLLAQSLPENLAGAVADFCAGWGYLGSEVVARFPQVTSLDLFEADHASLEAAGRNLSGGRLAVGLHWVDLASEPVERRFNAIVMNPPFHQGRAGDPAIGHAMIRAASAALKPNGRLFMVANRHLPYEPVMAASFRHSGETVRDQAFKILWGAR